MDEDASNDCGVILSCDTFGVTASVLPERANYNYTRLKNFEKNLDTVNWYNAIFITVLMFVIESVVQVENRER